jgi:hypothetical protein
MSSIPSADGCSTAATSHANYGTYLAYRLSGEITHLRQEGAIENVARGRWRLVVR